MAADGEVPASKKRARTTVVVDGPEAPNEDLPGFWCDVQQDAVADVDLFLRTYTGTVLHWKTHATALQTGPLEKYAMCGKTEDPTAKPQYGSLLVFYAHGFQLPEACVLDMLQTFFGPRGQLEADIRALSAAITRRLEVEMKSDPSLLATVLVAAARAQNLSAFQHFLHVPKPKLLFDVTLQKRPSVLRAVAVWEDPIVRKELVTEVLSRSTAAYILEDCQQSEPRTLLQDVACLPDPELMAIILTKLKSHLPQRMLVDAAVVGAKLHAATAMNPDSAGKLEAVLVQLTACMDEAHIGFLHEHLETLKQCALTTKRAVEVEDRSNPLYVQACTVLSFLPKVQATCDVAHRLCVSAQQAKTAKFAVETMAAEKQFAERYRAQLQAQEMHAATQLRADALAVKCASYERLIADQAANLRAIQTLTATVQTLRSGPEEAALRNSVDATLQDLDTRLLALQLPVAPGVPVPELVAAPKVPKPVAIPVLCPPIRK